MDDQKSFSSRWALLFAMLSMAVGTGSIWRFPRILATNGGGTFLVPWVISLFAWSIPLIILEFALGRGMRGPLGRDRAADRTEIRLDGGLDHAYGRGDHVLLLGDHRLGA